MRKRRSGLEIMMRLIGLVKPLVGIMLIAITLGTIGYLFAIFLTILASDCVVKIIGLNGFSTMSVQRILVIMVVIAFARGILHYGEQYCNHFIAFKLLAIIRHKVFAALRKLAPAKLEGKEKGNLISLITTDTELLEVFYAHAISPIAIAFCTSLIMVIFLSRFSVYSALFALCMYIIVGIVIPFVNGNHGKEIGFAFREEFGELNSFVLESLRGLDETIQYNDAERKMKELDQRSLNLSKKQTKLSYEEGKQRSFTDLTILCASIGMFVLNMYLYQKGSITMDGVLISTIAMMGSFGPVVALSNLSNNLNQTLASGERILSLLEEEAIVEEIDGDEPLTFTEAEMKNVTFAYEEKTILNDYSLKIEKGKIIGIHGPSGCGKSTLLKLLMRFWDVQKGSVEISDRDIRTIPTRSLRNTESYVTQETYLFHDTIANNVRIAKPEASDEEVIEACKKASIHDFIMELPQGYSTNVGELGDALSGGEKQRIGIARSFLHDAPVLLLDEPTSNLDSLNEGIILKALKEETKDKTVILVTHRDSTMCVCDQVHEMKGSNV